MSLWEIVHLALSALVFVATFWVNDDEPFINRAALALAYAVLWLRALILLALMLLLDGVAALIVRWRK